MDRNVDVRTPESIAFRYELAGLGSRCLAVCVDVTIQTIALISIFLGIYYAAMRFPTSHAHPTPAESSFGQSFAIAFIVIVVFVIYFGYHIVFEAFWNGQTPGKKMLGIRVVRDGGYPLDFGGAFLRNVIRIGEEALGFYALSAVVMLVSPENKRIGDYAAGTIVVREGRLAKPVSLAEALAAGARAGSGAYLTDDERTLVTQFLARRAGLDRPRRAELAAALAARFRERAPANLRSLHDEQLLEAL